VDNYTELFPLLQEYNCKATFFVISGLVGQEHYMTEEQLQELSASGLVDIESHTDSHEQLETLSRAEQEQEMTESQLLLARITRKIPYVLAYPSGSRNADTLDLAPDFYTFGVDMNGGTWTIPEEETGFFQVDRIYISRTDDLEDFAAKLP
jgi:peptidoglycan/xylan/chitin deacetylase (PgdA/CDA1 family)